MLFEVFPSIVYKTSGPNISDIPIEMSAKILRYLDPQSLSCAASTNKKLMNVCRGDPVLRERLRAEAQEKKKRNLQFLLNPSMGVVVTRVEEARLYNVNVMKNVTKRKMLYDPEIECVPLKRSKITNCGMEANKKKSVKKVLRRLRL